MDGKVIGGVLGAVSALVGHDVDPVHRVQHRVGLAHAVPVGRALGRDPGGHRRGQEQPPAVEGVGQLQHEGLVLPVCTVGDPGILPVHVHPVKAELLAHGHDGLHEAGPLLRRGGGGNKGVVEGDILVAPAPHRQEYLHAVGACLFYDTPGQALPLQGEQPPVLGGDGEGVVDVGEDVILDPVHLVRLPVGVVAHHPEGTRCRPRPDGQEGRQQRQHQERSRAPGSYSHGCVPAFLAQLPPIVPKRSEKSYGNRRNAGWKFQPAFLKRFGCLSGPG